MSSQQPCHSCLVDDCRLEHFLGQLEQQFQARNHITLTLSEASAAFTAHITEPDVYKFMDTCDQLVALIDLEIPLDYCEQVSLLQAARVALAVHENEISKSELTPLERSFHYLASNSLLELCRRAAGSGVTSSIKSEMITLQSRVEESLIKGLKKDSLLLDLEYTPDSSLGGTDAAPSLTPVAARGTTPKPVVGKAPRPANVKEKALAMLNDRPRKAAPLGRAHTMPSLSQSQSTSSSRSSGASKTRSRANGLQALQEEE